MKRFKNISKAMVALLVAAATLFASCETKFEESWDLAVNSNRLTLTYEAGMTSVGCYCTGSWKAYLDRDISWGRLENTSGTGTGYVRFHYDQNNSISRAVTLILEGNGERQEIRIVQRTGIGDAAVDFDRSAITYANGKYEGRLEIITNLPDEAFAEAAPLLVAGDAATANEGAEDTTEPVAPDWITDVVYHPAQVTGTDEEGNEVKSRPYITFVVQPYESGSEDRVATMKYGLVDASGVEYYASAIITQDDADGYITISEATVTREAHTGVKLDIDTNLTEFIDDMLFEVSYQTEGAADYITNVKAEGTKALFDIAENEGTKRVAQVTVSYSDLSGKQTKGSFRVIQRGETIKRPVEGSVIRELLTKAGDVIYASVSDDSGDYADYIELRVIMGNDNFNTETNDHLKKDDAYVWNTVVYDNTNVTAYAQTLDGKNGFRLKFTYAENNVLASYSKIRLALDGKKIVRENNPGRYTIANIMANDVELVEQGTVANLTAVSRTISTLKEEDTFNYVALADTEIAVKNAPYTYGYESMLVSHTSNNKLRDELATMVVDKDHKAIFALINSMCSWRRNVSDGSIVAPSGTGTLRGVIVHSPNVAYGSLGTYQIRPLNEKSFDMTPTEGFTTNVLAAWRLDLQTVSVGKYTWNGASAPGGYNATTVAEGNAEANFNKLHATHGVTDGSAILYSTNRKLMYTHTTLQGGNTTSVTNRQYFPGIVDGMKAVKPSYTSGGNQDNTCNSKASALNFFHDVANYYEWNEQGNWTGNTRGIVMEFPATAAAGTISVQFSMGSLAVGKTDNANKLTAGYKLRGLTYGFPLYWRVQCSTDEGKTWTNCTNAVDGSEQFKMNPTMHWFNGTYELTNYLTSVKMKPYTPFEQCPGFVQQKFTLPSTAVGATKVMVKISPASLRLVWYGGTLCTDSIDVPGNDCTQTYSYPHSLILEDVVVSYR